MNVREFLEKNGFMIYKNANDKFNELKEQFIEMGQLKSDFDIEKFTVKREGNFIAHNFHFLMRQYSLALSELRRMLIEKEDLERRIKITRKKIRKKVILVIQDGKKQEKFPDLYIRELENQIDLLEVTLTNKAMMVKGFEACRLKLIELNGGKAPTNEEYQAECPEYWKWFLSKRALEQFRQSKTGIHQGTWENIEYLEEPALINPAFQVKILTEKGMNMDDLHAYIINRKKLGYNHKLEKRG
jgi:hypothetical protein